MTKNEKSIFYFLGQQADFLFGILVTLADQSKFRNGRRQIPGAFPPPFFHSGEVGRSARVTQQLVKSKQTFNSFKSFGQHIRNPNFHDCEFQSMFVLWRPVHLIITPPHWEFTTTNFSGCKDKHVQLINRNTCVCYQQIKWYLG